MAPILPILVRTLAALNGIRGLFHHRHHPRMGWSAAFLFLLAEINGERPWLDSTVNKVQRRSHSGHGKEKMGP